MISIIKVLVVLLLSDTVTPKRDVCHCGWIVKNDMFVIHTHKQQTSKQPKGSQKSYITSSLITSVFRLRCYSKEERDWSKQRAEILERPNEKGWARLSKSLRGEALQHGPNEKRFKTIASKMGRRERRTGLVDIQYVCVEWREKVDPDSRVRQ